MQSSDFTRKLLLLLLVCGLAGLLVQACVTPTDPPTAATPPNRPIARTHPYRWDTKGEIRMMPNGDIFTRRQIITGALVNSKAAGYKVSHIYEGFLWADRCHTYTPTTGTEKYPPCDGTEPERNALHVAQHADFATQAQLDEFEKALGVEASSTLDPKDL